MILIQSDNNDISTSDVMDWIYYLNKEILVQRINDECGVNSIILGNDRISSIVNTKIGSFQGKNIHSFWYRRGEFKLKKKVENFNDFKVDASQKELSVNYVCPSMFKTSIGNYKNNQLDKLYALAKAKESGLTIPISILTSNKNELRSLNLPKIITKNIYNECIEVEINEHYCCELTFINDVINSNFFESNNTDSNNVCSFFQEYVSKKYELRIFYLNGEFFTMAIFSQKNEKTRLDFRNYDKTNPNRNVPYNLPKEIEIKLDCFMKSIDINCGSIDMIYSTEEEYVFLEVNPVGQYQWLERNCNYPVSKKIAETLINGIK